jgi:hypothetical protein
MLATITGMTITVECRGRAVYVEDDDGEDVCLLEYGRSRPTTTQMRPWQPSAPSGAPSRSRSAP